MHTIRVSATDSATGPPMTEAAVTVSYPNLGTVISKGTTAADGTATLKYSRRFEFDLEARKLMPVACDGSVHATGLWTQDSMPHEIDIAPSLNNSRRRTYGRNMDPINESTYIPR
jgi:hypothetical protein